MNLLRKPFFSRTLSIAGLALLLQGTASVLWAADTDGDGIPDGDEAVIGGDPMHKDIFVECDYMRHDLNNDSDADDPGEHTHELKTTAIAQLISIFAAAPVMNPDATSGITLHIDVDEALPEQRFLDFTSRAGGDNFFDLKATHFDFTNRAPYFRYCILAHNASEEAGSTSGQAEIAGNDFIVTLGSWPDENGILVGTLKDQIGAFMHEFGHTLGLDHGGGDLIPPAQRVKNHKPNYLSVMNYSFQMTGIDGQFDFSRAALPTLDENNLTEAVGILPSADHTRYFCKSTRKFVGNVGPANIDWNCKPPAVGVKENINGDRNFMGQQMFTTLEGYDDWANLRYDFTTASVYDAGAGVGFGQHPRYFGAYRPNDTTASRGVDREPESPWQEGRCLEFATVNRVGKLLKIKARGRNVNADNIGAACRGNN